MLEKQQPIVALDHPQKPKKTRPPRNNLMLRLLNSIYIVPLILICGRTDMRRGIDGLAAIVKDKFDLDPFAGQVFIFCGGSRDRFKALYWDGQGYWLLYKRFENGKMSWPNNQDEVRALSPEQVDRLMKGFCIEPRIKTTNARNFY